jgi:hypothetical protein
MFLGNTHSNQNPGPVNHTISQKDKESQWDTIPKMYHDSEAPSFTYAWSNLQG